MLSDKMRDVPNNTPGVYCLFDLDGHAAYGGKSGDLRRRMREHFIRQDSSVVSYGRLDIWDISHLYWWESDKHSIAERHLLEEYDPYLNFSEEHPTPKQPSPIDLEKPNGVVRLLNDEEREFRRQPYNRTQQKLDHLSRMVDKIRLAGHSEQTKQTLYVHLGILQENMRTFLDLDSGSQTDLEQYLE